MIQNVLKPAIKSSIWSLQRRKISSHSNSQSQDQTFYQKYSRGLFSTASLSFPVALWFSTFIYSTYTVRGDSMLPTLQDGDILLVRKSEFAFIQSIYAYIEYLLPTSSRTGKVNMFGTDSNDFFNFMEESNADQEDLDKNQRQIIQQIDASVGKYPSFFLDHINPLPGSIIVFENPHDFPKSYHVKRVIGLGGQNVRPRNKVRSIRSIPSYSLWVEGDNFNVSEDSQTYGPISKKLLLGQVERKIWPPSRWGKIERKPIVKGRAWWL